MTIKTGPFWGTTSKAVLISMLFALALSGLIEQAKAATGKQAWLPYSASAFTAAQQKKKVIVVDVFASWCPVCRKQEQVTSALLKDEDFADVVMFKVNYDTEKSFLRMHKIPRQSTILVFRGKNEVARSIAETRAHVLKQELTDAVMAARTGS